jgi:hypothetical protein
MKMNRKSAPEAVCLGKLLSTQVEGIVKSFELAEFSSELYEDEEQFLKDAFAAASENLPKRTIHRLVLIKLWKCLMDLTEKDYFE